MKRSFFQASHRYIWMHYMDAIEKKPITQECCVQSSTSPGSGTPQDTNCTAPFTKLFKLGEPDMQDIAGEAEMNS